MKHIKNKSGWCSDEKSGEKQNRESGNTKSEEKKKEKDPSCSFLRKKAKKNFNQLIFVLIAMSGTSLAILILFTNAQIMMSFKLPPSAYTTLKNGEVICRVLTGMWQLSGAHGFKPNADAAVSDMKALVDRGFTTFDLADHYGPAEDYVGEFRKRFGDIPGVVFFTKWVPQRYLFIYNHVVTIFLIHY